MKKLKVTDYIIILLISVLVVIGGFAVFKKKNFSKLPIEKEATIQFDVFFRGITITDRVAPFLVGEDAFITIRNVPYTKLKIVSLNGLPRMTVVPANNEQGYKIVEDAAMPNLYDFVVRLQDKAKKTPDGYVAGGNKIKLGIPVVIEGQEYKYTGTISSIKEIEDIKQDTETK